jgi:hypothetical protein
MSDNFYGAGDGKIDPSIDPSFQGSDIGQSSAQPSTEFDAHDPVKASGKKKEAKKFGWKAKAGIGLGIVVVAFVAAVFLAPVDPIPGQPVQAQHPANQEAAAGKNDSRSQGPKQQLLTPQSAGGQGQPAVEDQNTILGGEPARSNQQTDQNSQNPFEGRTAGTAGTATDPLESGPTAEAQKATPANVVSQVPVSQNTAASPASAQPDRSSDQQLRRQVAELSTTVGALSEELKRLSARLDATDELMKTPLNSRGTEPAMAAKAKQAAAVTAKPRVRVATRDVDAKAKSSKSVPMITESSGSDSSEKVQILGVTSKSGGGAVVISFAGVKRRYERGEMVPALGRVSNFGVDNGVPYVEIAGVIYR